MTTGRRESDADTWRRQAQTYERQRTTRSVLPLRCLRHSRSSRHPPPISNLV